MEVNEAIRQYERYQVSGYTADARPSGNASNLALSALRAQQERENPQPLTFEGVLKRIGKPVWAHATPNEALMFGIYSWLEDIEGNAAEAAQEAGVTIC